MGDGICFWLVGEGEDVYRIEDRGSGLRVAGWLSKAVVEIAAASPGHVREHSIERNAPLFVGVEAVKEEVAQEAAVLGDAFGNDAPCGRDGVGVVLRERGEVAEPGESASGNYG